MVSTAGPKTHPHKETEHKWKNGRTRITEELHLGVRGFPVLRAIGYNGDCGGEAVLAARKWAVLAARKWEEKSVRCVRSSEKEKTINKNDRRTLQKGEKTRRDVES